MFNRKSSICILCIGVIVALGSVSVAQQRRGFGGFGARQAPPGPPAPVPASVAIERPTDQEVAILKTELQRFIDTNNSPNKELVKKYASLMAVTPPRDNICIRPVSGGVRGGRHEAFVETAKNEQFDILFHGDSITDWWAMESPRGGKAVFEKYFSDLKIANFAVAGDTTQGLLWGLQNGEGQGHKPKAVMLMIGTNSAFSNTGPEIAEGVGAVVLELHKNFPDAKILLLAIFPRGANDQDGGRKTNEQANKIIKSLGELDYVTYMNINDKFLKPDGSLIGFMGDNLHPNEEGYEIWAKEVNDVLRDMIK